MRRSYSLNVWKGVVFHALIFILYFLVKWYRNKAKLKGTTIPNYRDFIVANRSQGEYILENLAMIAEDYKFATVADLKDLIGMSRDGIDNKFGWATMRGCYVDKTVNGHYRLVMTEPIEYHKQRKYEVKKSSHGSSPKESHQPNGRTFTIYH